MLLCPFAQQTFKSHIQAYLWTHNLTAGGNKDKLIERIKACYQRQLCHSVL